jgi:hypothetical protein
MKKQESDGLRQLCVGKKGNLRVNSSTVIEYLCFEEKRICDNISFLSTPVTSVKNR